ncbi:hypothetical protein GWK48_11305 [Metallosphaera tengchongensis]|uniref:Uncharacterized protein n=1 Tax=Metallosphaera tengchongensis TaxID=1532350 RepID=A0A6N0P0I5_9CREN|nr:hypothetical protein [Metallosphaera tengchongensis]QKR00891.1 hypothetical protein GWK48_11305 [Metallosphaera tengchongensis]
MMIKIGKISKDEEEYYFAYSKIWRQVKLKRKVWHEVKSGGYYEGEIDEEVGTLIKRVYRRKGKTVDVSYYVYNGDFQDLTCKSLLRFDEDEVRYCTVSGKTIYRFQGKYFEGREELLNFMLNQRRWELERALGEKVIRLRALQRSETSKAYLMKVGDKELWVPKSIVRDLGEEEVALPYWYVKNNGLGYSKDIEDEIREELVKLEGKLRKLLESKE